MRDAPHTEDLTLAEQVLRGDRDAWERFVHGHTGVIVSVLRRYLFDAEEVRDAYVDTLTELRRGKLAEYEGRSSLTTWLAVVARGAATDHLRRKLGRREDPAGLADLDDRGREVYRLYYVEGLAYADVTLRLQQAGRLGPDESLAEILADIESRLSDRTLRRIAWDLHAASAGAATGRLAEYLQAARDEADARAHEQSPERALLADRAEKRLAAIRELIASLPEEERRILTLRFDEGWTAEQVAEALDLPDRRRVYTIQERALARLRRWLGIRRS